MHFSKNADVNAMFVHCQKLVHNVFIFFEKVGSAQLYIPMQLGTGKASVVTNNLPLSAVIDCVSAGVIRSSLK